MDAIGGYFSLAIPYHEEFHKNAIRLNTGRNCLEYILRVRGYKKVYVPYYTCDAVMEPINKLGIPYEYYHVNVRFEIGENFTLNEGEALLYTNYFGLKQRYLEHLAEKIGYRLIVDNTQAFYAKPISGIDTFYTCRKFFGVPDGAYLYCAKKLNEEIEQDKSYNRVFHLVKRIELSAEEGYKDFRSVEDSLANQPIRKMSELSHRIMLGIEYDLVAQRRRANYQLLHEALGKANKINLPLENDAVPMVYPYFATQGDLHEKLIENRIYVASYWPNVLQWTKPDDIDYQLADQMQPLPIDQRYSKEDMNKIIEIINLK